MYYVYILWSSKWSKHYVGFTQDVLLRLEKHNSGGVKSTKHGCPWVIKWYKAVSEDRGKAIQLERKIKKRRAKRYLEDLDAIE